MNAPTIGTDLASYLTEVERLLDDLPDDDRRELIEDVREHITEVAAEDEGSLVERLGPPDVYAAELRASAGLPPRVEPSEESVVDRARRLMQRSPIGTFLEWAPVRAVRAFLPELKPGWWVLRGYLAAVAIDALLFAPNADGGLPSPSLGGSSALGFVFIIACVLLSVVAGRAATRDRRIGAFALVANAVIVLMFIAAWPRTQMPTDSVSIVQARPFGFLQHEDGAAITHICAYDEDGDRLKDVQLFDQDGRPVVGSVREKLDLFAEKMDGEFGPFPREKLLREKLLRAEEGEGFECPKKLEDLQARSTKPGAVPVPMEPGPPPMPRPFIIE